MILFRNISIWLIVLILAVGIGLWLHQRGDAYFEEGIEQGSIYRVCVADEYKDAVTLLRSVMKEGDTERRGYWSSEVEFDYATR